MNRLEQIIKFLDDNSIDITFVNDKKRPSIIIKNRDRPFSWFDTPDNSTLIITWDKEQ